MFGLFYTMVIRLNNSRSRIIADNQQEFKAVRDYLSIKLPESKLRHIKSNWDGVTNFVTKTGMFATGLLPLISSKFHVMVQDNRSLPSPKRICKSIGKYDFTNYKGSDYQYQAISKCVNNFNTGVYFPRGIINAATNTGKTAIMAGIKESYQLPALMLIHDKDVYRQSVEFFSEFFEVGEINSKKVDIKDFTVAMYKSLYNRSSSINVKKYLSSVPILFVDECHKAGGKDYRALISKIDSPIRFFMSGTSLDRIEDTSNVYLIGMSGPKIVDISNQFLINLGVSMKPIVYIHDNNPGYLLQNYHQEVEHIINRSPIKNQKIKEIVSDRKQTFISVRKIHHGEYLQDYLKGIGLRVVFVSGESEFREEALRDLKTQEIDVVISTVFRVGLNIPTLKKWINAMGGKSTIEMKQLMGRILRQDDSGETIEFHDFYDHGNSVEEHSKKRIKIYQNEGFEIVKK